MGYLNDAAGRYDRVLAAMGACDEQRDTLRTGFFLGAKTFLDAAFKSAGMDEAPGRALLDECRAEIFGYMDDTIREVQTLLEKRQ